MGIDRVFSSKTDFSIKPIVYTHWKDNSISNQMQQKSALYLKRLKFYELFNSAMQHFYVFLS